MSEVAGTNNKAEKKAANTDVGMWKSPVHIVLLVFLVMLALTSVQSFIISNISGCENKALNVLMLSGAMIAGAYLFFFMVMRQTVMNMIFHENKITPRGVLLYQILALVGAGFTCVAYFGESCTSDADGTFTKIACWLEDSYRTGIAMTLGVLSFIVLVIPLMVSRVPTPRQRKKAEQSAKEPEAADAKADANPDAKPDAKAAGQKETGQKAKAGQGRRGGWFGFGQRKKESDKPESAGMEKTVATGTTGPPPSSQPKGLFAKRRARIAERDNKREKRQIEARRIKRRSEIETEANSQRKKQISQQKIAKNGKLAASLYARQGSGGDSF